MIIAKWVQTIAFDEIQYLKYMQLNERSQTEKSTHCPIFMKSKNRQNWFMVLEIILRVTFW